MSQEPQWGEPLPEDPRPRTSPNPLLLPLLIVAGIMGIMLWWGFDTISFTNNGIGSGPILPFFAVAGLLQTAALIGCVIIAFAAKEKGRTGWWLYLICGLISPLNIAAVIAWLVHLKDKPWHLSHDFSL